MAVSQADVLMYPHSIPQKAEIRMRFAFALALAGLIGADVCARDQFNSAAAGCVPGDPALHFTRYQITEGAIKHRSSATGRITLYCNIPMAIAPPTMLELVYSDNDPGVDTFVSASYIKMRKANGTIATIATVNSNRGTQDGAVRFVDTKFSDAYDLKRYLYYVRVDLDRKATSAAAVFYGVTVY